MATGKAFATFTPSVAMILRKAKTPGRNKMDHTESVIPYNSVKKWC